MTERPPVVLLAAGESSRFWPLSTHGHKSLHRLCGKAIIEHTVESLAAAGFRDLVIVQSSYARPDETGDFPHRTIADQLGDGSRYGVRVRYVDQPEPLGQGDAIILAAAELGNGEFCVVQPENVNAGEVLAQLSELSGNTIAVQERDETWLFGVCAVDGDRVTGIVEKPAAGTEPSKLCSMGVAKLDREYLEVLNSLPPDPISSVLTLQELAGRGRLGYVRTDHQFFPLKYPWHLFAIAEYLKPSAGPYLGENVVVDPTATVEDDCVIESDAVIGPGVHLTKTLVGAGSRIGSSAADSIFGAAVTVESDVVIETEPVDDGHVCVDVKGDEIDTTLPALGTTVGQGTKIYRGSKVSAGVLVGAECEVAAGSEVSRNVSNQTTDVEPVRRK